MEIPEIIGTRLPHSRFGDPECSGCLNVIIFGRIGRFVCNDCDTLLFRVPEENVAAKVRAMESHAGSATTVHEE